MLSEATRSILRCGLAVRRDAVARRAVGGIEVRFNAYELASTGFRVGPSLVADGLPNKQIATALAIAERTVSAHLTSAMNKLGVDNRAHAAVVAVRRGLL